jgi:hypothetical protein
MSCRLSLADHKGACDDLHHVIALDARRAAARVEPWGKIRRDPEAGGSFRDYLFGQPIHCGAGLELQAVEYRYDDYGSYTVFLDQGHPVRYEHNGGVVVLYADLGGHTFTSQLQAWMRFRWPKKQ